jgi:hypothetical protein
MSYGNIRTPKIMVNLFEWLVAHKGLSEYNSINENTTQGYWYNDTFTNPMNATLITASALGTMDTSVFPFWDSCYSSKAINPNGEYIIFHLNLDISNGYNISPLINSVLVCADDLVGFTLELRMVDNAGASTVISIDNVLDSSYNINSNSDIENKGHVLLHFNETADLDNISQIKIILKKTSGIGDVKINSIIIGHIYEFEHSPSLSVNMPISFDGVSNSRTIGGHDSSIADYIGKPVNPFAYNDVTQEYNPSNLMGSEGRKSWDLNFNFLSDSKLLPDSFNNSKYHAYSTSYVDNFYSNVLSKTIGNYLKFLFIPNSQEEGSDYHICKFNQGEFVPEEVAPGLYNMSLKIVESW